MRDGPLLPVRRFISERSDWSHRLDSRQADGRKTARLVWAAGCLCLFSSIAVLLERSGFDGRARRCRIDIPTRIRAPSHRERKPQSAVGVPPWWESNLKSDPFPEEDRLEKKIA